MADPTDFFRDSSHRAAVDTRIANIKGFDGPGGGGYDGNMEARVKKLEDDMLTIKTDLGIIKATLATKTDIADIRTAVSAAEAVIHKEMHAQTWKLIGVATALVGAVYFLATHFSYIPK